jgi:hypothetical protein
MTGVRSEILSRQKHHGLLPASPHDFAVGAGSPISKLEVLSNPRISLYCLDCARRLAMFVEVPAEAKIFGRPFLYQAQFECASHVVTMSFDALHDVAASNDLSERNVVFVHSVGRCGSTLVSKAFDATSAVCSLSEPDVFTQLVAWRGNRRVRDDDLQRLTESSVRVLCKPMAGKVDCHAWAIKLRSRCMEMVDVIAGLFPTSRHLYLTREPLDWLDSVYRAFIDVERVDDEDYKRLVEATFAQVCPLVRRARIEGRPMAVWKSWLLHWISSAKAYSRLVEQGFPILRVDYSQFSTSRETTLRKIFQYCDVPLTCWESVGMQLEKDSQEGSELARARLGPSCKGFPEQFGADAIALLRAELRPLVDR